MKFVNFFLFFPKKCAVTFDIYLHLFPVASSFHISLVPRCTFLKMRVSSCARAREVANKLRQLLFSKLEMSTAYVERRWGRKNQKVGYKRDLGNWICIKSGISHPSCGQVSAAVKTASISAFHSARLDNVDDGGGRMGETSSALRLLE